MDYAEMTKEELIRQCKIKDGWCLLARDIGADYDGFNSVESLKYLVDELVDMCGNAISSDDKATAFITGGWQEENILMEPVDGIVNEDFYLDGIKVSKDLKHKNIKAAFPDAKIDDDRIELKRRKIFGTDATPVFSFEFNSFTTLRFEKCDCSKVKECLKEYKNFEGNSVAFKNFAIIFNKDSFAVVVD